MRKEDIEYMIEHLPEDCSSVRLELNGNDDTLALVRSVIGASLNHVSMSKTDLYNLQLATTEACTNVIRHAFKFDESKSYSVEFKVSKDLILVEVLYSDPGFDPETIPVPDLKNPKPGGLGVHLIRQIMDYVKYTLDSDNGNVSLKMVKLFEQSPKVMEA